MSECLQSADDFYNKPSSNEFSPVDAFLLKSIEDSTNNEIKGILWLFIWKEEQLNAFIDSKIECSDNNDDKLQLWMLRNAIQENANIRNNTINSLSDLRYNLSDNNERFQRIDFRITDAKAEIKYFWWSGKKYILNKRADQIITKKWENYEIVLTMSRDSNSSIRWDQKVVLNFSYDGYELIFFNDKNKDWNFDRHEWGQIVTITHKNETKFNRGTIYNQAVNRRINLRKNAITQSWVENIDFTLVFNK